MRKFSNRRGGRAGTYRRPQSTAPTHTTFGTRTEGEMPRLTQFLSDEELTELIAAFPEAEFAFAYGSGVVQQQASTQVTPLFFESCVRLWQPEERCFATQQLRSLVQVDR